jgi:hypothetical protein
VLKNVAGLVERLRGLDPRQIEPAVSEEAIDGLKSSECLRTDRARETVQHRLLDVEGVAEVLAGPVTSATDD